MPAGKIGKGLIASGVSIGVVENTLTAIALAYGVGKAGGAALAQIRMLIGINLSLGLLTIVVVFIGRALAQV